MSEIDKLRGEKLAHAVGRSHGWAMLGWRWLGWSSGMCLCVQIVEDYRPDRDIAQAWELDGEGWLWSSDTDGVTEFVTVEVNEEWLKASADYADFPTKAQAYATARCRAFLKAKAAQLDQADEGRGVRGS